MIKRWSIVLFAVLAVLAAESKDTYELSPLLIGADAVGRGAAYLGGEDSNHYVFQNYSFLTPQTTPRASLTVFKLINEINYLSAAYSQDAFSLGFLTIQDSGGFVRDADDNLTGGKIGYNDTTLYGAYAFQFDRFDVGARLKYQSKYFSEVDTSAWGLSLDLAGHHQLTKHLMLGAELGNVAGTALKWTDGLEEKIPLNFGIGGQFKLFGPDGYWQDWDWLARRTDVYADLRLEDRNSLLKTGVEFWPHDRVALRGGLQQINDIQDDENARLWRFTAGAGVNWNGIYFDYAFNPGDDIAENITHFFTISYRFAVPEKPATPDIEVIPEPEPVIVVAAPLRYRMFTDIDAYSLDEQYIMEDLGYLGFMIGYPDAVFLPEQPLTRKELMLILVRLAEKEGIEPDRAFLNFSDITRNATPDTIDTVLKASRHGYIRGYTDGSVRPEISVRRSEAAAAIARYYGIDGGILPRADLYTDVPARHWAYKDINQTKQHALTIGIGKELYRPDEYMKRLDVARILSRMSFVQTLRSDLPDIVGLPRSGNVTESREVEFTPPAPVEITPAEAEQIDFWYEEEINKYEEQTAEPETPVEEYPEEYQIDWEEENYLSPPPPPPPDNDGTVEDEDGWTIDYEY
ncbi:putative surface protein [Candidatus Termititenax aidoneus]|uniref:Surface protein n=1 Tax=Termititenax aidoneus TaxID=2218524 RepID=A0A388TFU0_TERA1|nr:putative surface protein [Candidatus Termititenax aidoneus]